MLVRWFSKRTNFSKIFSLSIGSIPTPWSITLIEALSADAKDVVIIIAGSEKNDIIQAVATNLGVGTKAHTVCLSLPVDGVAGLNL